VATDRLGNSVTQKCVLNN